MLSLVCCSSCYPSSFFLLYLLCKPEQWCDLNVAESELRMYHYGGGLYSSHMKWWLYFAVGWAPFRPGGADVEPGRCRRTDGKKWRCSRDSVGDQKYCERHINRGRQRSRKHVEGRKVTPTIAEPTMVVSGGVSSHSQAMAWQQQVKSLAANVTDPFPRQSNR